MNCCFPAESGTGCSAAWLARLTGGQKVAGSNPVTPTSEAVNPQGFAAFALRRRLGGALCFATYLPPTAIVDRLIGRRDKPPVGPSARMPFRRHHSTHPAQPLCEVDRHNLNCLIRAKVVMRRETVSPPRSQIGEAETEKANAATDGPVWS